MVLRLNTNHDFPFLGRRKRRSLPFFALIIGIWFAPLSAQPPDDSSKRLAGSPFFTVYEPTVTGARSGISSLGLDALGRILLTSGSSLITFDGNTWTEYSIADPQNRGDSFVIYTTGLSPSGNLYCTSNEGIHRVDFLADNRYALETLAGADEHLERGVTALRASVIAGDVIYFYGHGAIARLDTRDESVAFVQGALDTIASLAVHEDQVYTFGVGGEAFVRSDDQWQPVGMDSGGAFREGIRAAESWPGAGLFLAPDISSLMKLEPEAGVVNWPSELDELETHRVIDLEPLSPETLAVSVASKGIFLLNGEGQVIQVLDRSIDYRFGQARKLLHLGNGVVWAISEQSLIRVNFLAPLTDISILLPYAVTYPRLLWHGDELHIVTDEKIVKAETFDGGALKGFTRRGEAIPNQILNAISVEEGILCAAVDGVYLLKDDETVEEVARVPQSTLVVRHPEFPDQVVAMGGEEYRLIARRNGQWVPTEVTKPSPGLSYEARTDQNGVVWVELGTGKVVRLTIEDGNFDLQVLTEEDGLGRYWINVWKLDQQVYFSVGPTLEHLKWDPQQQGFVSAELELIRGLSGRYSGVSRPAIDTLGNLWVPTTANHAVLRLQPDGSYEEDMLTLASIQNEVLLRALPDTGGQVWLVGARKVFHYDPQNLSPPANPPLTSLYRIEDPTHSATLYDWRSPRPLEDGLLTVPYKHNDLLLKVTTPTIAHRQPAEHQYFLEGHSGGWVSFPTADQLPLSNLDEDLYSLRIRPVFGNTPGEEVSLAFEILPPIYRSPLAYLIYVLLGFVALLLVGLALRYRAERKNRALQRLVNLRTRELEVANTELKQLVRKAESATNAKTTFLHNVSHEMRTPLNGIIGPAALMMRQLKDEDTRSFVEIIKDSAERLRKIIEELLVFSENEAFSESNDITTFNLRELVGQLREEFAAEAVRRQLALDVSIRPRTPRYWEGDAAKIRQALRILLENALKFTEAGRVSLNASKENGDGNSVKLTFEVADTGIGISPELRNELFEPFHQGVDKVKGKHEGTGIGLAICQQLVLSMQGSIEVRSEPGDGSVFRLAIPLTPMIGGDLQSQDAPEVASSRSDGQDGPSGSEQR